LLLRIGVLTSYTEAIGLLGIFYRGFGSIAASIDKVVVGFVGGRWSVFLEPERENFRGFLFSDIVVFLDVDEIANKLELFFTVTFLQFLTISLHVLFLFLFVPRLKGLLLALFLIGSWIKKILGFFVRL